MDFSAQFIDYTEAGYFSKLVRDYISGNEELKPFYRHPVSLDGIKASIREREQFNTNRKLLVDVLADQYKDFVLTDKQQINFQRLSNPNTFTICTAHQPNIFTGNLYFIY